MHKKKERVFIDEITIRSLLLKKRMRILDLADEIDMSRQYLSVLLNKKSCYFETANKLAKGLNVPVEEIILKEQ